MQDHRHDRADPAVNPEEELYFFSEEYGSSFLFRPVRYCAARRAAKKDLPFVLITLRVMLPRPAERYVSAPVLEELDSLDALRQIAPAWDRLWARSPVRIPTARAELVAQWVEHFSKEKPFRALIVRRGEELLAAMPLVDHRPKGLFRAAGLTGNVWSPNGELLLDPQADPSVLDLLVAAIDAGPWLLVWLEMVPIETPHWQSLLAALARHGLAVDVHPRYAIGELEIRGGFGEYLPQRFPRMSQGMRKALRRQEREGGLELKVYSRFAPADIEPLLREAFEIERRGWKGEARSAVLSTPRMFEFYLRQARQLAAWDSLRLAFLHHPSGPIAFELGWTAKGVYHCYKVGYDKDFRALRPGHILRKLVIESLFRQPDVHLVDFQGPISEAVAAWSTRSYGIARVVIAPRRLSSRAMMTAYRRLASITRRLRSKSHS
jgi:CelD/BcsL family acetyltransferase involved in cellulose biosynthesis